MRRRPKELDLPLSIFADECYKALYPALMDDWGAHSFAQPRQGYTLTDVAFCDMHSDVEPNTVDLTTRIGPLTLPTPIISAAMDTVTGEHMARAMFEIGGCGVIYRTKKPHQQMDMIRRALMAQPCLVSDPRCVSVHDTLDEVKEIHEHGFSTIPVLDAGKLVGTIFTRDVSYKDHENDSVRKWMMPRSKLKVVNESVPFERVRQRLLEEQNCNVLPVVRADGKLMGMFFMKDMFNACPSWHRKRPLVGMAIGVSDADLERVQEGLHLGVGMIVIDSSHGNSTAVIRQADRVVRLAKGKAAIVAGNVAGIDGYYRLSQTGVDAVKAGIGSGSICTTSQVTGVAVPMWTVIRELRFAKEQLTDNGVNAPMIIADGGISGPGPAAKALIAGADAVMAGEWMVAADEALSHQNGRTQEIGGVLYNQYRGMASKAAIMARVSDRYGKGKTAPEGVEGWVPSRGPLKKWIGDDLQLIRGGFAHAGANNMEKAHEQGTHPIFWVLFTGAGQQQIAPRVLT